MALNPGGIDTDLLRHAPSNWLWNWIVRFNLPLCWINAFGSQTDSTTYPLASVAETRQLRRLDSIVGGNDAGSGELQWCCTCSLLYCRYDFVTLVAITFPVFDSLGADRIASSEPPG